ncbi:MAG: transposase, partial [Bacteriovorax sp.]|nr:transposase [Bacteriovorax sp.]
MSNLRNPGYIGAELFKDLFSQGLHLITKIKRNMKNILMDVTDKIWLKKRMIVESIFSSIKSCGTFEHSRHRSVQNAFCHIFSGLIFYQLRLIKPSFL